MKTKNFSIIKICGKFEDRLLEDNLRICFHVFTYILIKDRLPE